MKVFITGSSGVGKSTVIRELHRRGFTAYDSDLEPGVCRLEVKATGEPVAWPKGYVDWGYYAWNWQEPALKKLLDADGMVFIAGITGNQQKYYGLFDRKIILTVTNDVLERQLNQRDKRSAGDAPENIERTLRNHARKESEFVAVGFELIDNSRPVSQTVDAICKLVGA